MEKAKELVNEIITEFDINNTGKLDYTGNTV